MFMEINGRYQFGKGRNGSVIGIRTAPQPPEDIVMYRCGECGSEIYLGEAYYRLPEGNFCRECLTRYAQRYFSGERRLALLSDEP